MIDEAENIFIVGIKGVAMTNLAVILKKMGKNVSGADVVEEFITNELLIKNNLTYSVGFEPEKLPARTDLVVYSAAHQGTDNPIAKEAQKRGIKVTAQTQLIGEIMQKSKIKIAVAGSHGKTNTASLLSYSLLRLGAKPSYLVGAPSFNNLPGGDLGDFKYFVVEADEYGVNPPLDKTPKFNFLNPDYILTTNIDLDHPDMYGGLNDVAEAFGKFFDNKKLILCNDDPPMNRFINKSKENWLKTYGYSKTSDLLIKNVTVSETNSHFDLYFKNEFLDSFSVQLFGEKLVLNTAGVILILLELGFKPAAIKNAIQDFTGAKRRFEKVYFANNTYLFDDYAHHPKEIETILIAARERFPKRRIIALFQPHTFSRTALFLREFATSLSLADTAVILPIFASARENPKNFAITSEDIASKNQGGNLFAVESKTEALDKLAGILRAGDVVLTIGAGDVYKLANDIIELLKKVK